MPKAKTPIAVAPAPLGSIEARAIKDIVEHYYGADAIVRNFGPDPAYLCLHIETNDGRKRPFADWHRIDCLIIIMTKIDRNHISLFVTRRGGVINGNARIAYRQGVII